MRSGADTVRGVRPAFSCAAQRRIALAAQKEASCAHTGRDFIQPCMKSRPVRDSLLGEMGRVPVSRSRTYCWELSDEALLLGALPEDAALLLEVLSDEALPSVDPLSADSLAAALYWAASSSYFFWYLAMSRS